MQNPITRIFIITGFSIAITAYLINKVDKELHIIAEALNNNTIATEAIFKKVDADEKERKALLKLRKNAEVWKGTPCLNCHNTIATALPINKIKVSEAMKIVRQGTERTKEMGMPAFSKNPQGGITDEQLQLKLEFLYIKDFLE